MADLGSFQAIRDAIDALYVARTADKLDPEEERVHWNNAIDTLEGLIRI